MNEKIDMMIVRIKAIFLSVWFGVLPWWMYEKKKHHKGGYFYHLKINLVYAKRWLLFKETEGDRKFEKEVNENY